MKSLKGCLIFLALDLLTFWPWRAAGRGPSGLGSPGLGNLKAKRGKQFARLFTEYAQTVLLLDKYPMAAEEESTAHLSLSNISRLYDLLKK